MQNDGVKRAYTARHVGRSRGTGATLYSLPFGLQHARDQLVRSRGSIDEPSRACAVVCILHSCLCFEREAGGRLAVYRARTRSRLRARDYARRRGRPLTETAPRGVEISKAATAVWPALFLVANVGRRWTSVRGGTGWRFGNFAMRPTVKFGDSKFPPVGRQRVGLY